MKVNDLFVGTPASVFGRHPNGKFDALVSDVTLGKTKDGDRQILKISLTTLEGKAPEFMIFLIGENEAVMAASNVEYKEKLIKSIQMNKGVLVRLGLASEDVVKGWTQSEMVKAFASLKGRKLEIDISDDKNNPKYQRVQLNALVAPSAPKTQQSNNISDFDLTGVPIQPPRTPSLDDIPF